VQWAICCKPGSIETGISNSIEEFCFFLTQFLYYDGPFTLLEIVQVFSMIFAVFRRIFNRKPVMKISGNVSGNFARESFHCGKFPKRGFCADLARLRPNLQLIST
jgi:hypothetical protein